MIVAAFDMGTRNFAFCVEYIPYREIEKFLQMKTKPLFDVEGRAIDEYQQALEKIYTKGQLIECQRIDILDFCKSRNISNIYLGLTLILDKFICLWDKVDIFLIEQQMAYGRNKANIQALRLSQHCLSYFFTTYGSFREIIEWPSTHKTRILGCPLAERRTHKSRKQFSIELSLRILKDRKDELETIIANLSKQDDVSDCLLMIQAYKAKTFLKPSNKPDKPDKPEDKNKTKGLKLLKLSNPEDSVVKSVKKPFKNVKR